MKGDENVILFGLEGWTLGDLSSFIEKEPATYNIDALEASELVLISKSAYDELKNLTLENEVNESSVVQTIRSRRRRNRF